MSALARQNPHILPAFGLHPMHAACFDERLLEMLAEMAPQGVAIGEIGLDPGYAVKMELQEKAFREQLRLAVSLGLPLLIHCRQAFQRTLQLLREERADQVGGIMHAFSGSAEMAREFIRLGFVISISGTITWSNAQKPLRLAGVTDLKHLVLETDAPDMTPQRYRGRFNRPAWMRETAAQLALIKGVPLETVAAQTTANAGRILRLNGIAAGLPGCPDPELPAAEPERGSDG